MPSKKRPSVSLIISTYNWPSALNLCLLSIRQQSVLPDEVIIADDGSAEETTHLIKQYQQDFLVPLVHVWQQDDGFQLARIRNKALAKARYEYVIQIDGDLILHKRFVEDHLRFSRRGSFVSGSRVLMNSELSKSLVESGIARVSVFAKGIRNMTNGLRIPWLTTLMQGYKKDNIYYLRGCNMAFWKTDLLVVNGYNEGFAGWGREDNELAARLINSGVKKRIIKFGGIVFHIYHPEKSRCNVDINDTLLQKTITEKLDYSTKGVEQYL
jgi:glycosyltransferase involved in cell wall biosynthesis